MTLYFIELSYYISNLLTPVLLALYVLVATNIPAVTEGNITGSCPSPRGSIDICDKPV